MSSRERTGARGLAFRPGVTLTLRGPLPLSLDASTLAIESFAELSEHQIAGLPIGTGREALTVGDLFTVRGGTSANVAFQGNLRTVHGLGTALMSANLVIDGDAGDGTGAKMTGGRVHVRGRVGHDAGAGMGGGRLHVGGDAGDRIGAAGPGFRRGMTGGEIIVSGAVGAEAGARMRRGLIAIGGAAGQDLARDIVAGTIVALGQVGRRAGTGSLRGSIVATGGIDIPSTYRFACEFEPPFVRMLMTYLYRQFGLHITAAMVGGRFRRYCGDAGVPGRGEILEWVAA